MRLLQQVKGPVDVQKYVIQHAIKEAVRYKTLAPFGLLNTLRYESIKIFNFDF